MTAVCQAFGVGHPRFSDRTLLICSFWICRALLIGPTGTSENPEFSLQQEAVPIEESWMMADNLYSELCRENLWESPAEPCLVAVVA